MNDYQTGVNNHYGLFDDLGARILSTLQAAGKDIDALTRDDLSTFDEFHIGGVVATRNLAGMTDGLQPDAHVLDIGSGIGGPARTLAAEFEARVTGLDLTIEYCRAAQMLTDRVGLQDRITFRHGSALDMPFDNDTFDVAWTQFVGMNIENKRQFYSEVRRVLKNGGYLAFHEVMRGNSPDLYYPVFWANDSSLNFLRAPQDVRQILSDLQFNEVVWNDLSDHSSEWFEKMIAARAKMEKPPLGFDIFFPGDVAQKAANVIRNLEEKRVIVVQAVYVVSK